jgi:hypothetical protein
MLIWRGLGVASLVRAMEKLAGEEAPLVPLLAARRDRERPAPPPLARQREGEG